ncbi:MAG: hypothetical protein IBJ16_06040 [Chitinophagaceae bacterium]|nr:hypothetical protein [Chitinophagaceae bacterium]
MQLRYLCPVILACFFFILFYELKAQSPPPITNGHISGSFESYSQLYLRDKKINAVLPQDRLASNNFLKLDYTLKKIAIGVQYESYLPAIAGFPFVLNQSKIVNKYFKYTDTKFEIQIGDFYDQFGSGLIFRSWENRQIGINNALEGVKLAVTPLPFLHLKGIYGRQRKIFDYANSVVRGVDAAIDFSKINKDFSGNTFVTLGLSYVGRYQQYTGPDPDFPATVNAYGTRLEIVGQRGSFSAEYVYKDRDPNVVNNFNKTAGSALLINTGITENNLGLNISLRSLKNFDFRGERDAIGTSVPVNFIPALTRQHDYLTSNIYVYNPQAAGEVGGQVDLFYQIKGSRKQPSRIAVNFAQYRALGIDNKLLSISNNRYFSDFNIEWKKKWSNQLNTTLAYHNVFYNKSVIEGGIYENTNANIFIMNNLFKYAKNKSFRFELQALFSEQDNGSWAAAVTEFGFAPAWNFYLSDLYNYGVLDTHYPNIGGSYTKNGTRFSLGYGRQRAGLICIGGVCRFVPAATGFSATLTKTFNN